MNTRENIELNELSNKSNAKLVRKEIEYVLGIDSEMKITYNGKAFKIRCYADYKVFKHPSQYTRFKKSFAIFEDEIFGKGMNVSKITSRYISLYTFDMMDQRTTYKMALDRIIPGEIIVDEKL